MMAFFVFFFCPSGRERWFSLQKTSVVQIHYNSAQNVEKGADFFKKKTATNCGQRKRKVSTEV